MAQLITERHDGGIAVEQELLMIHGVLTSMCLWFSKIEQADRYLTPEQADDIWDTSLQCPASIQLSEGHGSCVIDGL